MKEFTTTALAVVLILCGAIALLADTMSYLRDTSGSGEQAVSRVTPLPSAECGPGPGDIATAVVEVFTATPTYLGDVPEGISKLAITVRNAGIVIGHQDDVATSPVLAGIFIASGGTYVIDRIGSTTHGWYGLATGTTNASVSLDAAW